MSCSNCYNGCTEIVSDKCVRYTGIDVLVLGIKNGDSLSYVEQALIEFLTSTLDGTGILPIINPTIICDLVKANLPTCGNISVNDILTALIKSTCSLQSQITSINGTLDVLNADYTTGCLTGVTASSDTHAILQAVITKLCATDVTLSALAITISTQYVKLADLDSLIQEYLDSQALSNKYYNKMIPYTVVEYYGDLSQTNPIGSFDITGKGSGVWDKVYLCNGDNQTPDKRGRSAIGVTQGIGGPTFPNETNPAAPYNNPSYVLKGTNGVNTVTLTANQLAPHTHTTTTVVNDPTHQHAIITYTGTGTLSGVQGTTTGLTPVSTALTTSTVTGLNTSNVNVTVNPTTGGQSHNNVHPVIACYYIMYIP